MIEQPCCCGKEKRLVPCYKINYPEHLRLHLMKELEDDFKCKKMCGQL